MRAPRVSSTCDDERVIGAPFYVMDEVRGDVITTAVPERSTPRGSGGASARSSSTALVEVHAVDWRACGLEGYGKPTGYLARQLRRFSGLWEHNRTREVPVLERVTAWLGEHLPESGPATIVHGDYRLGNTMFEPGPRLAWRRSSTGSSRRSATRSPTSATSRRPTRSPATLRARCSRSAR